MQINKMADTCVLFTYIILIISIVIITNVNTAVKSGPFKTKIVSQYPCKKPSRPIDKNPWIYFKSEIYNTSASNTNLIKGNVTIYRDNRNIKLKTKRHVWENGKWHVNFIMNNIGCQGLLMEVMVKGLGIKVDMKKCGFIMGSYVFKDLDPDKHMQNWIHEMEYGRIMWIFEIVSKTGSAFCWQFESIVSPKT